MATPRSRPRETVALTIDALGAAGDGVARHAGAAIHVPWTLPGERVTAELVGPRRARPVDWLVRAPDRADPACAHFGVCGGCALQHLGSDVYTGWKLARAREALERAGFAETTLAPLVAAQPRTRRRATFAASRAGGAVAFGFHASGSAEIVDLAECPVLLPALADAIPALRELAARLLAPGGRCDFALTASETGLDLLILGLRVPQRARPALAKFAATAEFARVALADAPGATPELVALRRAPRVTLGGIAVEPPPGAFLQATAAGEAAIVAATLEATAGARRVADLYAGCGTLALALLAAGAQVRAVDAAADSLAALDRAARRSGAAPRLKIETRDLERRPLIGDELDGFDAVVFDPPREGARAQAETLAASGPPRVVAVSCNPATFARDAAILKAGGYALERLTPIDQFLWSPHLELVGAFARGRRRRS